MGPHIWQTEPEGQAESAANQKTHIWRKGRRSSSATIMRSDATDDLLRRVRVLKIAEGDTVTDEQFSEAARKDTGVFEEHT